MRSRSGKLLNWIEAASMRIGTVEVFCGNGWTFPNNSITALDIHKAR